MVKKILIIITVFIGVYAAYFALQTANFYRTIYKNGKPPLTVVKEKTEYNFLLLGYGGIDGNGKAHEGTYLTDSIMVAHVDLEKNTISLLSLPRDLWIQLPTKSGEDFHAKINSIYQLGLFPKTFPDVDVKKPGTAEIISRAIKTVTGLTIDHYVTVDFAGFEKAIDSLGGVDVEVKKTFDDYAYPINGKETDECEKKDKELEDAHKMATEEGELAVPTAFPCRFEHLRFEQGTVHMDGLTALKYVRSRHSLQDGTDFGRGARQQQFVRAVKNKLISVGIVAKIFPLMDELKEHIETDVSVEAIKKFLREMPDATKYRFIDIRMSDKDYLKSSFSDEGGYILIPRTGEDNWKEIHSVIQNAIFEITPTPSPIPTKKVTPTAQKKK